MKRLFLALSVVGFAACSEKVEQAGLVPSSPTTYASVRIQGPTEVKVGESVQYRSFARLLGANDEVETTSSAFWSADPPGRLTIGAKGAASGATEGVARLEAIILGAMASVNVNVVGSAATSGEVQVTCPTTVRIGEGSSCTAVSIVNGVSTSITTVAQWSSSSPEIAGMANNQVIGIAPGTSFISATYEKTVGRAQVTVVLDADGVFTMSFSPAFNGCGGTIRSVLTGNMVILKNLGELTIGGEVQVYALQLSQGPDGRIAISGTRSANGFSYTLELLQTEPRGKIYSGKEDIRGPNGCAAQYLATMQK